MIRVGLFVLHARGAFFRVLQLCAAQQLPALSAGFTHADETPLVTACAEGSTVATSTSLSAQTLAY